MNPSRHMEADEQASLWAARLEGPKLSAPDRAALDAWLAADPSHRSLLSQYCQFAADLELTLPALVEAGLVQMPAAPAPVRRSRFPLFTGITLAAAAAVALALWVGRPATQLQDFAAPAGQHQSFTLADGTRVDLDAHTRLHVALTGTERRVQLSDGEAFFAVTKDAARPFIVDTAAGSVRVTGTQFAVRSEGAPRLDVTVAEGSVQVTPGSLAGGPSAPHALRAGDQLSAREGAVTVTPLSASEVQDALAWRQGQVVFDRVSLGEALARFARHHHRTITADAGAARLKLGGRFSLDDLDGFFAAVEEILPVKVNRTPSGPIFVNLRDPK